MKKKTIITILIFVLLLLCLLLLIYTYKNYSIPFNRDTWVKTTSIDEHSVRKYMARYLINNKFLIGKSMDEINQLLGQTSIKQDDNNKVYYKISEKYGHDIDPVEIEVIIVYFNQEEKAIKTELSTINLN